MNDNYNNQVNMNNQMNTNQVPNMNQSMGNINNGGQANNNQKVNDFIQNLLKDKASLIGYIGSILMVIANFLPFVVVEASVLGYKASDSFSYASTTAGKIVLVLAIASIVLIALKKHVYAVLTAGVALIQFVYNLSNLSKTYKGSGYYSSYVTVKWGIGIYLTLIGLIGVGVSIFLYWKENPNCFKEIIEKFKGNKVQNNNPMNQAMPVAPQQPMNNQPQMYNQQPMGGMQQPMPNQQMPMEPGQPMMNNQSVNNSDQVINNNQNNIF